MRIFQQSKVDWIDYRIAARTVKEFILSFQDRIDRRFSGMFSAVLRNVVQAVLYWSKKILKNIHMTDE